MGTETDLVTVYRSMDATAKSDCEVIADLLSAEGLRPVTFDDSAPGVPEGVYEVRVPGEQARTAEEIIAANPLADEVPEVDNSSDLDLETIFQAAGTATAEMEAMGIQSVLESNGVAAVIVGDSVLPNLGFEVRVAKDEADFAKQLIAEAQRRGPEDAEEAERENEANATDSPRQSP